MKNETLEILEQASKAYYEGKPIMTDDAYDILVDIANHQKVGYTVEGSRVKHPFRMYSLNKWYTDKGAKHPLFEYEGAVLTTPKLDGASISVVYEDGILSQVATRGDGREGIDITNKFSVKTNFMVPKVVPIPVFMGMLKGHGIRKLQVLGEIVAPKTIPNARNYAAGALNLKDPQEFLSRNLAFIAHGVSPSLKNTYKENMELLANWGFRTVLDSDYNEFPQDGIVWRIDNEADFVQAGHTSHHPKGAFALKEPTEKHQSTLIDVVWQVGKSGVVSPVAIIDPILIGEATISRATLHNFGYIQKLGLEIGCKVAVIRSGEIIPRITGRVEI
jgi:DNA ligase (NAD+)